MKAIKNLDTLIERLSLLDKDWQRSIYDKTGVILTEKLDLVSNCGCISLDEESDYSYSSGVDTTEYCEINSIDDTVSYIKAMESYSDILQDVSYGKFTKSEFYWGILERILLRPDNFSDEGQEWGLYNIGLFEEQVVVCMALIACDSIDLYFDFSEETTLDDALMMLVAELNEEVEYSDWLPLQKIFDIKYSVPNTYEELKAKCYKGLMFGCVYK